MHFQDVFPLKQKIKYKYQLYFEFLFVYSIGLFKI